MSEDTTRVDHRRPENRWARRLRRWGDRLFHDSDDFARRQGWEISTRRGGLGRSYRDPRFDALASRRYGSGADPRYGSGSAPPAGGPGGPDRTASPPSTADGRVPAGTVSPLERATVPLARPNPAVVAWRWRYELGAAAALAAGLALAGSRLGPLWTVMLLAGWPAAVAAFPGLRRFAVRRLWCVLTPHRVRTGCAHAWVHSRTGKIPAVLWTSAVPVGERVTLWCRAGTTAEDLEAARALLATACWARAVEVQRHPRRAQLVALVVVRHPTGRPARRSRRRRV